VDVGKPGEEASSAYPQYGKCGKDTSCHGSAIHKTRGWYSAFTDAFAGKDSSRSRAVTNKGIQRMEVDRRRIAGMAETLFRED
jgi:hypothetical protein